MGIIKSCITIGQQTAAATFGQNLNLWCILYNVYMVFLAGKSPNIRRVCQNRIRIYTAYIYYQIYYGVYIRCIYTDLLKPPYPYPYPYKWVYTGPYITAYKPYIYGIFNVFAVGVQGSIPSNSSLFCSFWSSSFLAPLLTELFLCFPFLLMHMFCINN